MALGTPDAGTRQRADSGASLEEAARHVLEQLVSESPAPSMRDYTEPMQELDAAMAAAQQVIGREAATLSEVAVALRTTGHMQRSFRSAVLMTLQRLRHGAKVVLVGSGQNAFVARKLAYMFVSMGTQSTYMHPSEALHGALGTITPRDVVVAVTNTLRSTEVEHVLYLPRIGDCLKVALTTHASSEVAHQCQGVLECTYALGRAPSDLGEAWPEMPAPTCSTLALLSVGDAFVVAVTQARGLRSSTYWDNMPIDPAHLLDGTLGGVVAHMDASLSMHGGP